MSKRNSNSLQKALLGQTPVETAAHPLRLEASKAEVERHLPLINKVVNRLMMRIPPIIEEEDLVAVGVLGLIDALERYRPGALSFAQYAEIRIRGAILDELRRNDFFSRDLRRKIRHYQEIKRHLEHRLGTAPSVNEIAAAMDISVDELSRVHRQAQSLQFVEVDSLELSSDLQNGGIDSSRHNPYQQTRRRELREKVRGALLKLPQREKMILYLYYFEEMTLRQIGDLLGLSESRVCQLHRQACRLLQRRLGLDPSEIIDIF